MKKGFLTIMLGLALAVPATQAKVAPYDGAAQLAAAQADMENWMKYLPDDMFVAHVSMPGSHDTATGHNVTLPSISQAQEVLLPEQLKGGIRAFDFRPGFSISKDDPTMANPIGCNHGGSKTDLTMEEAFTMLADYLTAHPSEFFAIHLFRGAPSSDPKTAEQVIFNKAVDQLFNSGKFNDFVVDFDPYLKVKDIRGKIVIFRRDRLSWMDVNKAGNLGGWPGDKDLWTEGAAATATNAKNPTVYGLIKVTDVSSPKNENELNTKLNSITNLYTSNCNQVRPNAAKAAGDYKPEWSMIFTSGEYTSGKKGYLTCATHTNPHLTKLINEATVAGPTGIVFSDWVLLDSYTDGTTVYEVKSNDLLKAIVENNFKYAADYILDDELFNDENEFTKEPDVFGNNEYFMRHVQTGKFLSAGADWGTHAVLADNGIRIKTFFDRRTGKYLLQTTFRQNGVDNYLGDNAYIDNTAACPFKVVKADDADAYYLMKTDASGDMALSLTHNGNTYADGTTDLVDYVAFNKDDKAQQWELVTEEELLKELAAKATNENPSDLSFMIRGYKLHPNDDRENGKWMLTNETPKASTTYCVKTQVWGSNEWNDKDMIYRVFVDKTRSTYPDNYSWELTQDIEGLPEGVYTVSANAMIDNIPTEGEGKFEMTANGADMLKNGIHTESTGEFTCDKGSAIDKLRDESLNKCLVQATDVKVGADGKLNIRMAKPLKTAAGKENFFFDNFSLKYHGNPTGVKAIEAEKTLTADSIVDVFSTTGVILAKGVRYADIYGSLANGIFIVRTANASFKVMK